MDILGRFKANGVRVYLFGSIVNLPDQVTPAIRSEGGRRRFFVTVVSEYNELPSELRSLSYPAFKRNLQEYLWEQECDH